METVSVIAIAASDIGERYADLRIIQPKADKAMERSMGRYGQLTPVAVGCRPDERYEMVDGFKRLRAGRKLGYSALHARVMSGSERVLKAAIIDLNAQARTIAELETALVIQSLYRATSCRQFFPMVSKPIDWSINSASDCLSVRLVNTTARRIDDSRYPQQPHCYHG